MKQPLLTDGEIANALSATDGPSWELIGARLVRVVAFKDFGEALAFVNAVGEMAEEQNHHPDIDIRYNKVTLALVTHDSGGITRLDIELARAIDVVAPSATD